VASQQAAISGITGGSY